MMMANSPFGLEDMEALLWGPFSPMADAVGPLFHPDPQQDKGGETSLEEATSPVSPLISSVLSSSPPPFYSPPPSPPAALHCGDKAGTESNLLSFHWLGQLSGAQNVSDDDGQDDVFTDLDWMAERVDLSEFDLDSLIGSCSPSEEPPSSPEDLLTSLVCPMELDSTSVLPDPDLPSVCSPLPVPSAAEAELHLDRQEVPEPQEELEIKSEPASPDPPPSTVESASSPVYTLDLGSEVDVSAHEVKLLVAPVVPQVQRLVLSLSPTRIVVVLAPKDEVGIATTAPTVSEVLHSSPPQRLSRSRPYSEPPSKAKSPLSSATENKVAVKAPKNKKLKKMEQNKTAATRYRQKKRAEQDALLEEHSVLERKNVELTEKSESLVREIQYLKDLMEEVRLAKMRAGVSVDP